MVHIKTTTRDKTLDFACVLRDMKKRPLLPKFIISNKSVGQSNGVSVTCLDKCNGAKRKHHVLLQIERNGIGNTCYVVASVRIRRSKNLFMTGSNVFAAESKLKSHARADHPQTQP